VILTDLFFSLRCFYTIFDTSERFLAQARETTCHFPQLLKQAKIRYKAKTSFPEFIQAKRIFYLFLKAG